MITKFLIKTGFSSSQDHSATIKIALEGLSNPVKEIIWLSKYNIYYLELDNSWQGESGFPYTIVANCNSTGEWTEIDQSNEEDDFVLIEFCLEECIRELQDCEPKVPIADGAFRLRILELLIQATVTSCPRAQVVWKIPVQAPSKCDKNNFRFFASPDEAAVKILERNLLQAGFNVAYGSTEKELPCLLVNLDESFSALTNDCALSSHSPRLG